MIHLKRDNEEFWPSKHGYGEKNYSLKLDKEVLIRISETAYLRTFLIGKIIEPILSKTLESGVCSGISAYTLCNFYNEGLLKTDYKFWIAVFQARTWGSAFLRQALYSYFLPMEQVLNSILKGIEENVPARQTFLVFLPRPFYLKNITQAHTVIPFRFQEGLQNIYISVFDSNFPSDDTRIIVYNKTSGFWHYDDKDRGKWVLTVNYLENLTRKVTFLL